MALTVCSCPALRGFAETDELNLETFGVEETGTDGNVVVVITGIVVVVVVVVGVGLGLCLLASAPCPEKVTKAVPTTADVMLFQPSHE